MHIAAKPLSQLKFKSKTGKDQVDKANVRSLLIYMLQQLFDKVPVEIEELITLYSDSLLTAVYNAAQRPAAVVQKEQPKKKSKSKKRKSDETVAEEDENAVAATAQHNLEIAICKLSLTLVSDAIALGFIRAAHKDAETYASQVIYALIQAPCMLFVFQH